MVDHAVGAESALSCLRTIEFRAAAARAKAGSELANLALTFGRTTDLCVVAAVLTGGPVRAQPNLVGPDGERVGGTLHWIDGTPRLSYERYHPHVRQRFSIAHELGHFFLHARDGRALPLGCVGAATPGADARDAVAQMRHREEEADAFAAAFLLPPDELAADRDRFGRCIAFLAERHVVAPATMRRRLETLELLSR